MGWGECGRTGRGQGMITSVNRFDPNKDLKTEMNVLFFCESKQIQRGQVTG